MAHDGDGVAGAPARELTLPVLIFGLPEIRRLNRELGALEEFMRSAQVRQPGTQPSLPRLSRLCEALAIENHLNLLQPEDRKLLASFMTKVEHTAPQVHISFASDPSSAFTSKIVTWLRSGVHPWSLLQVGLEPNIAAGCVVRTSNKVFDFSLRERFVKSENLLLDAFEAEIPKGQVPLESATTPETPAVAAQTPVAAPVAAVAQPAPAAPVVAPEAVAAVLAEAVPAPQPQVQAAVPEHHIDEATAAAVAMEVASVIVPEEVTEDDASVGS